MRLEGDRSSEINFRRLRALAEAMGDEDFAFLDEVASKGVRLGVDIEMPRTPEVYEEKVKWTVDATDEVMKDILADNYESAEENAEDIERQVLQEVEKGTIIRMMEHEAKRRFKGRLAVAALGAVPKELGTTRVRLIHDGTYSVDVNRRIRVRDRMRFPLIDDAAAILRQVEEEVSSGGEGIRFSVLYDIARAHKLVPVAEEDWGLQAFRLPGDKSGDIFVHTRGTFGVASAAYWFGRVIAVAVRCTHRLLGRDHGLLHLIYADDGWLAAVGKDFWRRIMMWFFAFELLEIPVTWSKVRGGTEVNWIGYCLNIHRFQKGINQSKRAWIADWIAKKLEAGGVVGRELKSVLGRLSFVAGALRHVRPFLAPLFSWSASMAPGTFSKFPDAVVILLEFVKEEVQRRPMRPVEPLEKSPVDVFRVDAKAAGEEIAIGGWGDWTRPRSEEGSLVLISIEQEDGSLGLPEGRSIPQHSDAGTDWSARGGDGPGTWSEMGYGRRQSDADGADRQLGQYPCAASLWIQQVPFVDRGHGVGGSTGLCWHRPAAALGAARTKPAG